MRSRWLRNAGREEAQVSPSVDEIHPHSPLAPRTGMACRPTTRPRMARKDAVMKWNLRLVAANRGIWKASQLQRMLAEWGLVFSAGKMSYLWSGQPASIKLEELEVICAVLSCSVDELLIADVDKQRRSGAKEVHATNAGVLPQSRDGRDGAISMSMSGLACAGGCVVPQGLACSICLASRTSDDATRT